MCGIFAYLNYNVNRDRKFIANTLVTGLKRLEYRGYDSAGVAIDGDINSIVENIPYTSVIKKTGKVAALEVGFHSAFAWWLIVFPHHRTGHCRPPGRNW